MVVVGQLPDAEDPNLHLDQPTSDECTRIWNNTSASWRDSLTVPVYLAESQFLTTVPLARDGGMTAWVLVDKTFPPGQRPVLCSCETFRKRSLISDGDGNVEEGLIHGIASVFCPAEYRGRGYGTRLMTELAKALHGWQSQHGRSIGSVLYSDIGKEYYTRLGWFPHPRNSHYVFPSVEMEKPALARQIPEPELEALCLRDEAMVRAAMAAPSSASKRVTVLPDLDHMLWHIRKEDFATGHIFGKKAEAKGAIAGSPGKQVWAIWVHRYYGHPDKPGEEGSDNVLYILRLVVEGDETANKPYETGGAAHSAGLEAYTDQAAALKAVMQAAQAEAAEWQLDYVKLWEPSRLVESLVAQSGLDAVEVQRQEDSIASALWFTEDGKDAVEAPIWINNEHYAWC